MKYFALLVILVILFYPYIKLLKFTTRDTKFKYKKKRALLTPLKKVGIYILIFIILIFIPVEIFLRIFNIQFAVSPHTLLIDDFHPTLQTQMTTEDNKYYKDLNMDSSGFRGEEITQNKPKNTYRIFILGGSTAFLISTPYQKSAPRLLEKMLSDKYKNKRIEVLNAAVEGYTTEQSIIEYLFKIKDYKPDLIIAWQGINDMGQSCQTDNGEPARGPFKSDYSNKFGAIRDMVLSYYLPKPLISFSPLSFGFVNHFVVSNFYSDFVNYFKSIQKKQQRKRVDFKFVSIDAYRRNLQSLVDITKADNVGLILGNQPYLYTKQLDKTIAWGLEKSCLNDKLTAPSIDSLINGINSFNSTTKQIAEENNVGFVDLESKIPKNQTYFVDEVHFVGAANNIVANTLFSYITNNNLIK